MRRKSRLQLPLVFLAFLSTTTLHSCHPDDEQGNRAPIDATLIATPESTAKLTVKLEISASVGSSSDTDVQTVSVSGPATIRLSRASKGDGSAELLLFDIALGRAAYSFDFFCLPFFGCKHLDLSLENFHMALTRRVSSVVGSDGPTVFEGGEYFVSADYTLAGFTTGKSASVATTTGHFAGQFGGDDRKASLTDCTLSPQVIRFSSDSLPSGVNSVTMTILSDLENVRFEGPWKAVPIGPDLTHDSVVNEMDLAFVLASWGSTAGDVNGDCVTDALDLALILEAWGE